MRFVTTENFRFKLHPEHGVEVSSSEGNLCWHDEAPTPEQLSELFNHFLLESDRLGEKYRDEANARSHIGRRYSNACDERAKTHDALVAIRDEREEWRRTWTDEIILKLKMALDDIEIS